MRRRPTRFATAAVCLVGALLATGCSADNGVRGDVIAKKVEKPGTPALPKKALAPQPSGALVAPVSPPVEICGPRTSERGMTSKPKGAVTVRPSQRLDLVIDRHRAGTTFWLTRGTYTLGKGEYSQVQPKDHDRIIGAGGVVIDGRHHNRYAFGGHAVGVVLRYLTVRHFGRSITDNQSEGVVNHDAGHGWSMQQLNVRANAGAGIFMGTGDSLQGSCLRSNGQYGLSAYEDGGVRNLRVIGNEIAGNNAARWESRVPGCGCSGGAKFWAVRVATIRNNYVHDNRGVGLWADTNNTGLLFQGNYVARNTNVGIMYETSYNAHIVANTFTRNALVDGPHVGFPQPALYISESGSDRRAGARFASHFLIARNRFINNYSGVVLWENADRFVSNNASDNKTLVNPKATVDACRAHIRRKPYINDCRWKTQKVEVVHNTFILHKDDLPASCRVAAGCGYVGVFSQWGSTAPFRGDVVPGHITFHQGNSFRLNTYVGPWHFMAWELGDRGVKTWRQWRSAPYREDKGSTHTAS